MKTLAVLLLFFSSLSANAADIQCMASAGIKRESFDTKVPREPDSVSHVIGLMIYEAQTVNEQGIKLMIADSGRGGYGSAIAILAPGQTLTYVTNDSTIYTLACVYK